VAGLASFLIGCGDPDSRVTVPVEVHEYTTAENHQDVVGIGGQLGSGRSVMDRRRPAGYPDLLDLYFFFFPRVFTTRTSAAPSSGWFRDCRRSFPQNPGVTIRSAFWWVYR
jgi:hypothetical protein